MTWNCFCQAQSYSPFLNTQEKIIFHISPPNTGTDNIKFEWVLQLPEGTKIYIKTKTYRDLRKFIVPQLNHLLKILSKKI